MILNILLNEISLDYYFLINIYF